MIGQCAGGDVVIFGMNAQQEVAHAAPRPVGLVAGFAQLFNNTNRCDFHFLYVERFGFAGSLAFFGYTPGMNILGIETSCDDSAAAVVQNGQKVLSNVIASQIDIHAVTGGVVPEVASREHVKAILPVVSVALSEAGLTWDEIDAIAVTVTPGLVGSLLVGRMCAATLAELFDKPLIEVNHIHGHMYSPWLDLPQEPEFPILCLTVSGGHNSLYLMRGHGDFELLGRKMDDAAGEAFDKCGRLLGLPFPGGPHIEKEALLGDERAIDFPVAQLEGYDFSFSGLKTSVLYYLRDHADYSRPDVCASFQRAVVRALVRPVKRALKEHPEVREVHLAGGVSANKALRAGLKEVVSDYAQKNRAAISLRWPSDIRYCTDNAAMIAGVAYYQNYSRE